MSIIVPIFDLAPIDPRTGKFTRPWYEFFSKLANANADSAGNDFASLELSDTLAPQPKTISESFLLTDADLPQKADYSLMGFWPGDTK